MFGVCYLCCLLYGRAQKFWLAAYELQMKLLLIARSDGMRCRDSLLLAEGV